MLPEFCARALSSLPMRIRLDTVFALVQHGQGHGKFVVPEGCVQIAQENRLEHSLDPDVVISMRRQRQKTDVGRALGSPLQRGWGSV